MKTKTEYYKRTNKVMGGGDLKHYPSGTSILMDMVVSAAQDYCKKRKVKK
jgi:hypothetical protein